MDALFRYPYDNEFQPENLVFEFHNIHVFNPSLCNIEFARETMIAAFTEEVNKRVDQYIADLA